MKNRKIEPLDDRTYVQYIWVGPFILLCGVLLTFRDLVEWGVPAEFRFALIMFKLAGIMFLVAGVYFISCAIKEFRRRRKKRKP